MPIILSRGTPPGHDRAVRFERDGMVVACGDRRHTRQAGRHVQGRCISAVAQHGHRTVGTKDGREGATGCCGHSIGDEVAGKDKGGVQMGHVSVPVNREA